MANVRVIEAIPQRETALRVAAYCRVSSGSEDQLHSYASQIKHYTELIQNTPGWQLVDIYADEGISGTGTDKREEFQRMLRDARRGKMDKILVKSSSRFARNTHDCLAALRELKAIGVSVRFEKENLDTENLEIELMLAVSGSLAQEESVSISNNQRISYKNRMEKGTFLTCKAPFGYELVNGNELRIKEDEAKLVRWIFESYLSGKGIYEMAEEITAMGIPSRDGRPYWQHSTILYVLRNEKYCGDALVQKTFATDTFPSRKQHNKGEKAQYYIQNSHPAIISRETFEQAQRLCDSRRAEHGEAKEYPLSRKLVYGECGATFKRRVSQRGYVSWVCRRRDRSKDACTVGRVAEESIYAAFMELCRTLKAHGDTIIQPAIDQLQALQKRSPPGQPGDGCPAYGDGEADRAGRAVEQAAQQKPAGYRSIHGPEQRRQRKAPGAESKKAGAVAGGG